MRHFLSYLVEKRQVSGGTHEQALSALRFAFDHGLGRPLAWMELTPVHRPVRLPVVLSPAEVAAVLERLIGAKQLVATLLYGSGLRLMEALNLRVKDPDFDRATLTVRGGKGNTDRSTMLPPTLHAPLRAHLVRVRRLHERDLARGTGSVALPGALARKIPGAARAWGMAVGVSRDQSLSRCRYRGAAPTPPARDCGAARREGGRGIVRRSEASELPHVPPLLCHAAPALRL